MPNDKNKFLTAEQIAEFASKGIQIDTPEGEQAICAYCGTPTNMRAYTYAGKSWPPCCPKEECMDEWKPLRPT